MCLIHKLNQEGENPLKIFYWDHNFGPSIILFKHWNESEDEIVRSLVSCSMFAHVQMNVFSEPELLVIQRRGRRVDAVKPVLRAFGRPHTCGRIRAPPITAGGLLHTQ